MKREIKFRAWDKYLNKMLCTGFSIIGEVTIFGGLEVMISETPIKDITSLERLLNLEIMQYTGLKDKFGVEIYEGDILNGSNNVKKIVEWDSKRSAFVYIEQFKPKKNKLSFAEMYDKFRLKFNYNGTLPNHYIIGNIYETPELINQVNTNS